MPIGSDLDLRGREGAGPTAAANGHQWRNRVVRPRLQDSHRGHSAANEILRPYARLRSTSYNALETHRWRTCVAASAVGYGHSGHEPVLDLRKCVVNVVDAGSLANKPRVDDVAVRGRCPESAMIDLDRKLGVAEVAIRPHWEAEIRDRAEKSGPRGSMH